MPKIACSAPIDDIAIEILKPHGEIVVAECPAEDCLVEVVKDAAALIVRGLGGDGARDSGCAQASRDRAAGNRL